MTLYSDDSSDSEKKLFQQKKNLSIKKSIIHASGEDKSQKLTEQDVVKSPSKKSPPKRLPAGKKFAQKIDQNVQNVRQNSKPQMLSSSDDEQVVRRRIKVKQYMTDSESEDESRKFKIDTCESKKSIFDDKHVEILTNDQQDNSIRSPNSSKNFATMFNSQMPINQYQVTVEQELMSCEDNNIPTHTNTEEHNIKDENSKSNHYSESKRNRQETDDSYSSDNEIPPSQYWLQKHKEIKEENCKSLLRADKQSLPKKMSDSKKKMQSKGLESAAAFESHRKSPPRITKTEIISKKYTRLDRRIGQASQEHLHGKDSQDSATDASKDCKAFLTSNDIDVTDNDERTSGNNNHVQGTDSNEDVIDAHKCNNDKKSPKRIKALLKQEVILKPIMEDDNLNNKINPKMSRKSTAKRNLSNILNNSPFKKRPDICDSDSSNEKIEEHTVRKKETKISSKPMQSRPTQSKPSSVPGNKRIVLVQKNDDRILSNDIFITDKTNASVECKSDQRKLASSSESDENIASLSNDELNNAASSCTIKKKRSSKSKNQVNSDSDEAQTSVRQSNAKSEPATIKQRRSSKSSAISPNKKPNSNDSMDKNDIMPSHISKKTSIKRKHQDSTESIAVVASSKKPRHTLSDSDDTDSLTKLNTTLNKSMAFMGNQSETVKLTKSNKSVSINEQLKLEYIPNDTKSRKSILKRPDLYAADSNEQVLKVQESIEPISLMPKTMKRPLTFKDFEHQHILSHDSSEASFGLEDLSDNDEIYLLEIPKMINPKALKGQTVKLSGKNKLQIGEELYETCEIEATNISCVFNSDKECSYKTVNFVPVGSIHVRRKLPKASHIQSSAIEKMTVPFPKGLKIRHPLFGSDYKDKIIVANRKVPKTFSPSMMESPSSQKMTSRKSKKIIRSEGNSEEKMISKDKLDTKRDVDSNKSTYSDSDSDGSFFQNVIRNKIGNVKKRNTINNLSSISIFDNRPSLTNRPDHLDETVIANEQHKSSTTKLRLLHKTSVEKPERLHGTSKKSLFFSSTPIKVEVGKDSDEEDILTTTLIKKNSDNDNKKQRRKAKNEPKFNSIQLHEVKKDKTSK